MTVTHLGRPLNGTMNSAHRVSIWNTRTGALVAAADIGTGAPLDAAGFKVAALSAPAALKNGEKYRIVSSETRGGDKWYDVRDAHVMTLSNDCRFTTSAYSFEYSGGYDVYPSYTYDPVGVRGHVGVTFYYTLDAAMPPSIALGGQQEITINVGESYEEPGYSASDAHGEDLTESVSVTDNIEEYIPGVYTVTYEVEDENGDSARSSRTVFVTEEETDEETVMTLSGSPIISVIGSDPIILHIGGTPYKEQGARAIDADGRNISDRVEVIGAPDTARAGTYTVTYRVVNDAGVEATATREVRILAPTEARPERIPYGFSGQGREGQKVTHTGIVSYSPGFMDLNVKNIGKNMSINAQLVDSATMQTVMEDRFTAIGAKQYSIGEGRYELVVTVDKANGNGKYAIDLLMPEEIALVFEDEEVPLGSADDQFTDVPEDAWYKSSVGYVAARGFADGVGGGEFMPEAPLTLGLLVSAAMKAFEVDPDPGMFDGSVGDSPYALYLEAAELLGILGGDGVSDSDGEGNIADRQLTREEMFATLYRLLAAVGETPDREDDGKTLQDFVDYSLASESCLDGMSALIEAGLVNGVGDGLLAPKDMATRAEMAAMIHRLLA